MIFKPQIRLAALDRLCYRLSSALQAGVDVRNVWKREADKASTAGLARRLRSISQAIDSGDTLQQALARTGEYFPPIFRELVAVGEETGQLPEVLRRLHEHYDHQLQLRRDFLRAISWPLLQLVAAVLIVGFLIWIMGVISSILAPRGGAGFDITGLGLMGTSGAIVYFTTVAVVIAVGWLLYELARRGAGQTILLHRLAISLPVVGPAVRTLALSRMAWAMHLTFDTGMPLNDAIPLVLGSTGNLVFARLSERVTRAVSQGKELSEALAATREFPRDFLDVLEVGEMSGRIPESMATVSEQYQDKAQRALATLTMIAGFVVWALIALLIGAMIIRLFYVAYYKPLMDLM